MSPNSSIRDSLDGGGRVPQASASAGGNSSAQSAFLLREVHIQYVLVLPWEVANQKSTKNLLPIPAVLSIPLTVWTSNIHSSLQWVLPALNP